jgi:hydrogenase expression/formation protein HypD
VENQYARSVRREGNRAAQELIGEIFRVIDRRWRGVGDIPRSGFGLSNAWSEFDAERKFGAVVFEDERAGDCIAGLILQGIRKPEECPAFGGNCTPERPLGAPMVSSEGACAAYYRYRKANDRSL